MEFQNSFGQPVGPHLPPDWTAPSPPDATQIDGQYVTLERLTDRHALDLWHAFEHAPDSLWTYLSIGPFADQADFIGMLPRLGGPPDWVPYAICDRGKAVGFASYLRVAAPAAVLEIGSIAFSPELQQTRAATEALFLMIDHAFALGYRRVEWKCDDLNAPSRTAAKRLGFSYEGTFRRATHYKGRSRDTAWFAIIDEDWPSLSDRFQQWLSPSNFDDAGHQLRSLSDF